LYDRPATIPRGAVDHGAADVPGDGGAVMAGWVLASLVNYFAGEINWRNGQRARACVFYVVSAFCAAMVAVR
jgi:hypothetical protein